MAAQGLDDDEKAKAELGLRGSAATIISEAGLYRLVMRSDKPEAKPFQKWVTGEVLPSIRRTGRYAAPAAPPITIGDNDMLKLRLVNAVRLVFGRHAAGQFWAMLGLPLVPAMLPVLRQASLFGDVIADMARSTPTAH